MKTFLDCIPCIIRQSLDSLKQTTDDKQMQEEIMKEVMKLTADIRADQSPPAIAQQVHRLIRERIDNVDPYHHLKQQSNRMAVKLCAELAPQVRSAVDPFEVAVRLAIAGNIIDLGAKSGITNSEIKTAINDSLKTKIDNGAVEQLKAEVSKAKKILYLADNAGEIVFDRLLMEQLPAEKITLAVRGAPIINDATIEDADFAGLTEIVNVIDNGSDCPGTILEECSELFQDCFAGADLIISKGQGNYETLSDVDKNIFFLVKVKCQIVAADLNCKVGDIVLTKSKACKENVNINLV
jgi:damage-control phosphatase, subfamily I